MIKLDLLTPQDLCHTILLPRYVICMRDKNQIELAVYNSLHVETEKTCIELRSNLSCPAFFTGFVVVIVFSLELSICNGKKSHNSFLYIDISSVVEF